MMQKMRDYVDVPPLWLLLFLILPWSARRIFPGAMIDAPALDLLGGIFVGGGVLLALLAVMEMRRYSTTVMPHQNANTLVQSGIFRRSRNPIYLGDLAIFLGLSLFWGALICAPLVLGLAWLLTDRFIRPEENRLRDSFGRAFDDYAARTRRWI